ncbi:MAG: sigma-70 family RNA polymerase sigma factor [Bacteroidetes bacterium]|nr:hypothetical protein AWN76_010725 [Rhodothermaceae bacterium RA]RMH62202.1 MAG: sigma-70 family RNA polymerase sigma factor [Bacteroidota bacterium]
MDQDVTQLLLQMSDGDREALNRLMPLVYDELRVLARHKLRYERADHTFDTAALVHEAYLKLVDQRRVQWQNRSHFFAIAARSMRRILVNYAARHRAQKRGGGRPDRPLDEVPPAAVSTTSAEELIELDDLLRRLAVFNERGSLVVEYRFFGGMTYEEIAEVLGVSPATVRRSWSAARAWLQREVRHGLPERLSGEEP